MAPHSCSARSLKCSRSIIDRPEGLRSSAIANQAENEPTTLQADGTARGDGVSTAASRRCSLLANVMDAGARMRDRDEYEEG